MQNPIQDLLEENPEISYNSTMTTPSAAVRKFHVAFEIPAASCSEKHAMDLRLKLIREEFLEVINAANKVTVNPDKVNQQDMLKELADLVYVIYGTAETFGWNLDDAFTRVHQSNMSKLGPDGKPIYRADGKVLKGPNYKEPYLGDLV